MGESRHQRPRKRRRPEGVGGGVGWAVQDLCPFSQQKQAVSYGATPQLPITPSVENYAQLSLDSPGGGLRIQPGGLPPASDHGLLQKMAVPL